ncbi:MAG: AraC family transcriptional regulator [Pseudomonadota bacterium]
MIKTYTLEQKDFCWSGIGVRNAAAADCNKAAHRHSFFQIVFVAGGEVHHEIGGKIHQACEGSIYFINPATVHRASFPDGCACYFLYFSPQFLHQGFGGAATVPEGGLYRTPELAPFFYQDHCSYQLEGAEIAEARGRCERIAEACSQRGLFDAARARAELVLLLTQVAAKFSGEFKSATQARRGLGGLGAEQSLDKRVRAALQYMHRQFGQPLALEDVARSVNLSGTSLTHLLKAETGKSFKKNLDEIRLDKAKDLLAYTDAPVQRVAEGSGFLDQGHFARRFKDHTALTPSEFRKRHQSLMDQGGVDVHMVRRELRH